MIALRLIPPLAAIALMSVMPTAANAGFFESLFGTAPVFQAPHLYGAAPDRPVETPFPSELMAPRKPQIAVTEKPTPAQIAAIKATTLMTDKTLRPGDVAMTAHGIRVFRGRIADRHSAADFVTLDEDPAIPKAERAELTAINANRVAVDDWQEAGETPVGMSLVTGRSVATDAPEAKVAVRGKGLRRIGP